MTVAAVNEFNCPIIFMGVGPRSSGSVVLDAANDQAGHVFVWNHADAVIDKVACKIKSSAAGTVLTVSLEIWTVDETTTPNEPAAIIAGASATQALTAASDNLVLELTLGTPPTLSRGTKYAVVIRASAFTSGSSSLVLCDNFTWPAGATAPYTMTDVAAAGWSLDPDDYLCCALGEQTTGTYRFIGNALPPGNDGNSDGTGVGTVLGQATISTTASKDEVGNIFQVQAPMRTYGFWCAAEFDDNVTIKLTSSPLGTPSLERSYSFVKEYRDSTTELMAAFPWATPFELAANTDYCLSVVAETTTNSFIPVANCHTAAMLGCYPGGTTWIYCDRDGVAPAADGGVFTKVATRRLLGLGLGIDGLDDGAGGGGGGGVKLAGTGGGLVG